MSLEEHDGSVDVLALGPHDREGKGEGGDGWGQSGDGNVISSGDNNVIST